jgi:FkbM family methyltransferase
MKLDKPLRLNFGADESGCQGSSTALTEDGNSSIQHDAELQALKGKVQLLETEKNNLKKKLESEQKRSKQYGGDAQIDGFLADLSPYFYKKKLTYVDVGAFTGEVFQKIYESGILSIREAHLFEPNPESYKAIENRLKTMALPHTLHTYNFALGKSDGEARFYAAKSMTKKVEGGDDIGGSFKSQIRTLDEQIENITDKHIHLLKIDVEGSEIEVIEGAYQTLANQLVDVIYIELGFNINGKQQVYFGEVDRRLQELGYRAFGIYEQKNEWIEDSPFLRRCNFAYFSSRFAQSNPYLLTKELHSLRNR